MELQFQNVYQQVEVVCVGFGASLGCQKLREDLFSLIEACKTPVIFVIRVMQTMCFIIREEEEEFLFPVGGFIIKKDN